MTWVNPLRLLSAACRMAIADRDTNRSTTIVGLADYALAFDASHVDWQRFRELTSEDPCEIGVRSVVTAADC